MAVPSPVIKQIDKQFLVCGICLDHYTVPKVLPCLHTFCQKCLQNYLPPESLSLSCPLCRQLSILPAEGVAGLQTNFFITNLMEVLETPECNGNDEVGRDSGDLACTSHDGEKLKYYCNDCETAVCYECTMTEHGDHQTTLLADVIEEHKEVLRKILEDVKSQIPIIKDALQRVEKISDGLSQEKASALDKITRDFESLEDQVKERKHSLLQSLEGICSEKSSVLEEQKLTLQEYLASIESNCGFTEKTLLKSNDTEILLIKKQMLSKLQELAKLSVQTKAGENDFLKFSCDLEVISKCITNLGIIQSNSAVPHETVASGDGLKRSAVGVQTVVMISTKNHKGEIVKSGGAPLTAKFDSADGREITTSINDNKNGTYDVIYTPSKEGIYMLDIRLFNEHIRNSPFRVKVVKDEAKLSPRSPSSNVPVRSVRQRATRRPHSASGAVRTQKRSNPIEDDLVLVIGSHGRNKGEFTNPQGIACSSNGRIVVADSTNQSVQVFTNEGEIKLKFGIRGRSSGQLQRPTGVAVAANGNFAIADYDNKWVNIFSPEGKYINKIAAGKLVGPKGIAVDKNNNLVVVDNRASTILVFTPSGKLLSKFGSRGSTEQQLCGPHFVAVNNENEILVSDFHNHCIKVFDHEGQLVNTFGSRGEGNGQFNAPTGLAVDVLGNIIVADWGNSRIQIFDHNGSFLSYVNTTADPLYGPQDLAITSDGHVAVSDSGNHCVKLYKYLQ